MQEIKYSGKIIEVVQEKFGEKVFERARRSPGVRALIVSGEKILLSREFRKETGNYDYRLPGGKVFDSLEEYKKHLDEELLPFAKTAVIKEVREEVGLIAKEPRFLKISHAGATVEWDLYYFLIDKFDFSENGQELEDGEDISFAWYGFNEVKQMCINHKVQEDRSVGVLLSYIIGKEGEKEPTK